MHADEGAWHGGITGQEERAAFLQQADESVAHGVDSQIRPIVAYANHNRRWLVPCSAQQIQRFKLVRNSCSVWIDCNNKTLYHIPAFILSVNESH